MLACGMTDEEVVARAQAGEKASFEVLYNCTQNPPANDEHYQLRQALEADGWALWEQVCTTIEERCSGLNAEYGKEVITNKGPV